MKLRIACVAVALMTGLAAHAEIVVKDAWVRATVAQQGATGAFLTLTSSGGAELVGVATPAAGVAEVHEMKMVGDVMKMSAVPSLALPAGKAVELKPGGYHVMLMNLKQPIKAGDTVPLTLLVKSADGKTEKIEVKAEARAMGAPQPEHSH